MKSTTKQKNILLQNDHGITHKLAYELTLAESTYKSSKTLVLTPGWKFYILILTHFANAVSCTTNRSMHIIIKKVESNLNQNNGFIFKVKVHWCLCKNNE